MRTPSDELSQLSEEKLLRTLRPLSPSPLTTAQIAGQNLINFSSNDYLGLSRHPALIAAAQKALTDYGTGSTASRLVCGSLQIFHELEEQIALLKKTEAALSFANGYATATGCIPALVGKGDTIILDKLAHACLIPHNDLNKLEKLLKSSKGRTLIITESVFSMDGDLCPLAEIIALKEQHGALLLLDEAHAIGILGPNGQGLAEELGLQAQVEFQMGTLGKALGSAGGYLAASREWIDLLINKARSFIYSTAPPPAQAAASLTALQLLTSDEGLTLRKKLAHHCQHFASQTPIIPKIIGTNDEALNRAETLLKKGFLVPAIRYPTVPRGSARLRITLSAAHSSEDLNALSEALQ